MLYFFSKIYGVTAFVIHFNQTMKQVNSIRFTGKYWNTAKRRTLFSKYVFVKNILLKVGTLYFLLVNTKLLTGINILANNK